MTRTPEEVVWAIRSYANMDAVAPNDALTCYFAADMIESLQSQLSEYTRELKTYQSTIVPELKAQLAESQRREQAAVEMNEDNRVRLLQYDNLRKCFSELCDLILGRKYYNEAMDAYRADEFCCRDIWDKVKPMLSRKHWHGPQDGKGEAE